MSAPLGVHARGDTYFVLGVSSADEQQFQGAEVPHTLARTPHRGLQEGLAQLREDATVIQHSREGNTIKVKGYA